MHSSDRNGPGSVKSGEERVHQILLGGTLKQWGALPAIDDAAQTRNAGEDCGGGVICGARRIFSQELLLHMSDAGVEFGADREEAGFHIAWAAM